MQEDFIDVTEFPDQIVPLEQVKRLNHRYIWASSFCEGKDTVEVACGSGYALNFLKEKCATIEAGDFSAAIVKIAKQNTLESIDILQFDACKMPYQNNSKDIIIIFEAIYYLDDFTSFINEAERVLRPSGQILIATANKDLYDFNPSPHSTRYFGVTELNSIFLDRGWDASFFGFLSTNEVSIRQKLFRPIKKLAASLNLIPDSMDGKTFLKKIVFGKSMPLPSQLDPELFPYDSPISLEKNKKNQEFKVIYCRAKRK